MNLQEELLKTIVETQAELAKIVGKLVDGLKNTQNDVKDIKEELEYIKKDIEGLEKEIY